MIEKGGGINSPGGHNNPQHLPPSPNTLLNFTGCLPNSNIRFVKAEICKVTAEFLLPRPQEELNKHWMNEWEILHLPNTTAFLSYSLKYMHVNY